MVSCLSWNIHGKLELAVTFLKNNFLKTDFIHISETHHAKGIKLPELDGYTPISSPSTLGIKARGGNILFVKKGIFIKITKILKKDWCIVIILFGAVIMFVYIPPEDSLYTSSKLFTELDNMIESYMQRNNNI